HGVGRTSSAEAVTVPRHRVAAIAVVAQPGRDERLSQLIAIVLREPVTHVTERTVRPYGAFGERSDQARHVDHGVVHLTTLGTPPHLGQQLPEQVIGSRDPARADVDPRTAL